MRRGEVTAPVAATWDRNRVNASPLERLCVGGLNLPQRASAPSRPQCTDVHQIRTVVPGDGLRRAGSPRAGMQGPVAATGRGGCPGRCLRRTRKIRRRDEKGPAKGRERSGEWARNPANGRAIRRMEEKSRERTRNPANGREIPRTDQKSGEWKRNPANGREIRRTDEKSREGMRNPAKGHRRFRPFRERRRER